MANALSTNNEKRMAKAETLLSNGAGISETCHALGFEEPAIILYLLQKALGLNTNRFPKKSNS